MSIDVHASLMRHGSGIQGALAGAAREDDAASLWIGQFGSVEDGERHQDRTWDVPGLPLIGFAHVDQKDRIVRKALADSLDIEIFHLRATPKPRHRRLRSELRRRDFTPSTAVGEGGFHRKSTENALSALRKQDLNRNRYEAQGRFYRHKTESQAAPLSARGHVCAP